MIGNLTKKEELLLMTFAKRAKDHLKDCLVLIELFGSKVRGNAMPDSDIDILLVVKEKTVAVKDALYSILFEIDPYYTFKLSLIVYSEFEYNENVRLQSPFIENVIKEGVML